MFCNAVGTTALTSREADYHFVNIPRSGWNGDVTFCATLRALVAPRMSDNDTILFDYVELSDAINLNINYIPRNTIYVINVKTWDDEAFDSFADSAYRDGWTKLEKVRDFFVKSFKVCCLIDHDTKRVCLMVENMNMRKWHYLQCSVLAFLPWYFDPNNGVSEIEMELIKSLREKNSDNYLRIITEISKQYDFETIRVRSLLGDFEINIEKRELAKARASIADYRREIATATDNISRCLECIKDEEIRALGLEQKLEDNTRESELMNYFLSNKNIKLNSTSDGSITFVASGYVTYFDEDMARSVINRPGSYVYSVATSGRAISTDDMKKLMSAIFIEQKLKVRVCAAYSLDIVSQGVSALRNFPFDSSYENCMPNIHINKYSCMGNYIMPINESLERNDYISAIETCCASCKSLNFADSIVMSEFMRVLYGLSSTGYNDRCIELPDGRVVKPINAIKWLNEQEEENE